jgi:hypothetical protein
VLLAAVLLALFEADMLWMAQEQNLFLHTPLFFEQQMVKAGGLLTWMGCYLTQFFYYPMLGAGVLCLLWAFLMWLLQRVFRLDSLWVTLVPVSCLLLTITTLGYWLYYRRFPQMLDFCYLVNPYFPSKRMKDELRANFDTLLTEYPSGMKVNTFADEGGGGRICARLPKSLFHRGFPLRTCLDSQTGA